MKPPSLLDPKFKYRSSVHTNVAETFRRVRREQMQEAAARIAPVVVNIKQRRV